MGLRLESLMFLEITKGIITSNRFYFKQNVNTKNIFKGKKLPNKYQ